MHRFLNKEYEWDVEQVLRRISNGETLTQICDVTEGMPHYGVLMELFRTDADLWPRYVQSRQMQATLFMDEAIDMSRRMLEDGKLTKEQCSVLKEYGQNMRWMASRLDSETFGGKMEIEVSSRPMSMEEVRGVVLEMLDQDEELWKVVSERVRGERILV